MRTYEQWLQRTEEAIQQFQDRGVVVHRIEFDLEAFLVWCRATKVKPSSRSVILVDFQRTTRRRKRIFAVRTEDGPVVKRLRHADGNGWRLVSDNKAYKPVPWPEEAVVLGQVMWTGRTL